MIKPNLTVTLILILDLLTNVAYGKSLVSLYRNEVFTNKVESTSNEFTKAYIANNENYPYTLNRQDYLLKACLDYNYEKVGFYKIQNSKDFSTLAENYRLEAPSNIRFISDYVEKNANFYNEDYSKMYLSYENFEPPYNAIFARCIDFSKSPKAKVFLDSIPVEN